MKTTDAVELFGRRFTEADHSLVSENNGSVQLKLKRGNLDKLIRSKVTYAIVD